MQHFFFVVSREDRRFYDRDLSKKTELEKKVELATGLKNFHGLGRQRRSCRKGTKCRRFWAKVGISPYTNFKSFFPRRVSGCKGVKEPPVIQKPIYAKKRYTSIAARVRGAAVDHGRRVVVVVFRYVAGS